MRNYVFVAFVLALTAASTAQRTWIVDRLDRPGADFTDLPAAVAAAGEGDVLLLRAIDVRAHRVSYTAPVIDSKGLVIRGDPLQATEVTGQIAVRNLSATQRVVLSDLHLGTFESAFLFPFPNGPMRGLDLRGNRGAVHLDQVVFGFYSTGVTYRTSYVVGFCIDCTDCDLVTIAHSTIHLVLFHHDWVRSNVVATDTRFLGGIRPENFPPGTYATITAAHSRIWLVDSEVHGTNGGPSLMPGRNAIAMCSSEIHLAGASRIVGGIGWGTGFQAWPIVQWNGSANPTTCYVTAPPAAHVIHVDPRVTLQPDQRPNTMTFHADVVTAATWTLGTPSPLTARVHANPNGLVVLAAGFVSAPPTAHLGGIGVHLDLGSTFMLGFGLADATGTFTLATPIATVPSPGVTIGLQAVELLPNGALGLSNVVAPTWYR